MPLLAALEFGTAGNELLIRQRKLLLRQVNLEVQLYVTKRIVWRANLQVQGKIHFQGKLQLRFLQALGLRQRQAGVESQRLECRVAAPTERHCQLRGENVPACLSLGTDNMPG